jgi:hypothetical protein
MMDSERIAEIREWLTTEKELYARFCKEANPEALHLVRARVSFMAFRDIPALLDVAEAARPLLCGHPSACLKHYTKRGGEVCLRCEWDKKRSKKK